MRHKVKLVAAAVFLAGMSLAWFGSQRSGASCSSPDINIQLEAFIREDFGEVFANEGIIKKDLANNLRLAQMAMVLQMSQWSSLRTRPQIQEPKLNALESAVQSALKDAKISIAGATQRDTNEVPNALNCSAVVLIETTVPPSLMAARMPSEATSKPNIIGRVEVEYAVRNGAADGRQSVSNHRWR